MWPEPKVREDGRKGYGGVVAQNGFGAHLSMAERNRVRQKYPRACPEAAGTYGRGQAWW